MKIPQNNQELLEEISAFKKKNPGTEQLETERKQTRRL